MSVDRFQQRHGGCDCSWQTSLHPGEDREYLYESDVTTWGWIHLIAGAVVGLAGFFLLSGAVWAQAIGIIVAVLSAISSFLFIPYYPFWSLLIIALDVLVAWALVAHGRALRGAPM